MKTRQERADWIEKYLRHRQSLHGQREVVDVLNRDFVDDYAVATGAKHDPMPYGADKCRQLGADLRRMYRNGILKRSRTGIQGMAGMGFPRWVWSYELRTVLPVVEGKYKVNDKDEIV